MNDPLHIVWLSWKDLQHPYAGGAELLSHELRKRLSADGHAVTLVTSAVEGEPGSESVDGYTIIRSGSRYSVYLKAWMWYRKQSKRPDLVVDEMNTFPFFAKFYAGTRVVLFTHQLAREIWYYEMNFPISSIV
jgi:hypothetical protein